jgi:hypothetical protein
MPNETIKKQEEDDGSVPDDRKEGGRVEPKEMTLDEWKAEQDARRAKVEFNLRKPGEGCSSDPCWKKMYVLTKKEKSEEHGMDGDEGEVDLEQDAEHHGSRVRNVLPIEIRFADESLRGRGRGGLGRGSWGRNGRGFGPPDNYRGESQRRLTGSGGSIDGYREQRSGGRGGAVSGRGRFGGGARHERAPNFKDEMDFPSLDKVVSGGVSGSQL